MANETVNSADSGITTRGFIIGLAVILFGLSLAFHTALKGWLCENAWFHTALIDGPAVALAIIAWRELDHSGKANEERRKLNLKVSELTEQANRANEYRAERNELEKQNVALRGELAASTQQIADNLKRPPTRAERNAATLRKYMRRMASVTQQGQANAAIVYEIVDLNEDNILTLFSTPGPNATGAYYNRVDCEDLTVDEMPHGSCPVRVNVVRYQGQATPLGQCPRWEDRYRASVAAPSIEKASGAAWSASYVRAAETRTLGIFQANDGSNRFQLESSQGLVFVGDNVQVSKNFMLAHIEYLAENFTRSTSGTGATQGGHRLYIC